MSRQNKTPLELLKTRAAEIESAVTTIKTELEDLETSIATKNLEATETAAACKNRLWQDLAKVASELGETNGRIQHLSEQLIIEKRLAGTLSRRKAELHESIRAHTVSHNKTLAALAEEYKRRKAGIQTGKMRRLISQLEKLQRRIAEKERRRAEREAVSYRSTSSRLPPLHPGRE